MSKASIERMRAEFERTSLVWPTYIASMFGVLIGPAVVLAIAVAVIIWLSHWSNTFGLVLSFFVLIGALSSAIELGTVVKIRAQRGSYEFGWNGVLFACVFSFVLFVCALFVLYMHFKG